METRPVWEILRILRERIKVNNTKLKVKNLRNTVFFTLATTSKDRNVPWVAESLTGNCSWADEHSPLANPAVAAIWGILVVHMSTTGWTVGGKLTRAAEKPFSALRRSMIRSLGILTYSSIAEFKRESSLETCIRRDRWPIQSLMPLHVCVIEMCRHVLKSWLICDLWILRESWILRWRQVRVPRS